jgi:hypothetical protein
MPWTTYKEFDEAFSFAEKAGFQLSKMQIDLANEVVKYRKTLNKCEVGCGKTVLSTVASYMLGYDVTVVTMPPILISGWTKWLKKFGSEIVVFRGTPKERKEMYPKLRTARWILCSHAIFRDDFEVIEWAVKKRNYEIINDEAQWSKNPKSILFKKLKNITSGDVGYQALTGTPTSKPTDSYTYIKLKNPEIYRSYGHFEAVHVAERDFFKNPTKYDNLDKLKIHMDMQSVTATKEEMHGYNLKPLVPDCSYDLAPEHYRLYAKLVDEQLLTFADGSIIDASTSQKLRQALQQIVVNWEHFAQDESCVSQAYAMVNQTIEEIDVTDKSKSKLIIWTQYKRTSRNVTAYCNKLGIKTVAAYSEADTEKSVEAFLEDENTRILVAQPSSCGAGLNPQYVCSEALFLEMSTSPIYMRQACGRIDRLNQTRTPRFKFAVANGTVQVGLLDLLLRNDDMVAKVETDKKSIRSMLLGGR